MNVTPAAISHQVKALEDQLGVSLFHRKTRALRLTDAAQAALPALSDGFDKLFEGAQHMRAFGESNVLNVSVSPGFGSLWLLPRLDKFRQKNPDVEIRIDCTDRLVNVARGEADIAIRYGPGGNDDVRSDRLFAMQATPVCCPDLLAHGPDLRKPSDLKRHTLLHVEWKETENHWRTWLLAAGIGDVDPFKGPKFTKEEMSVRAALEGEGVALIGDRMAADHLASGRLVRPFEVALSTPLVFAYYLLRPICERDALKVSKFREWILEEAKNATGMP